MEQQLPTHSGSRKTKRPFLRRIFLSKRPPPPSPLTKPSRGWAVTATSTAPEAQSSTSPPNDALGLQLRSTTPRSDTINSQPSSSGAEFQPTNEPRAPVSQPSTALPPEPTSSGIFNGAHNFRMDNPTIIQNKVVYKIDKPFSDPKFLDKFFKDIDNGGTVLLILDKKRIAGAEMGSSDRDPPPRCHPATRQEIRETLTTWLSNDHRRWDFIWLSGPAGAGKSAVAQTFAEHCESLGQLGASFFFSRLKRDTANGFIATIAYQLAGQDAGYNNLITRILARSPAILDKALHVQFQKLIVEPFAILAAQYSEVNTVRKPLVIIVDGLDECSDEDAQCQILRLIGEYVPQSASGSFPVLWLLCSRPEWHIKRTFAQADPPFKCDRKTITCDAAQDVKDVYLILKDGLQDVRNKTSWSLSAGYIQTQWPLEPKLQRLSQNIGGLPVLASTVIRFIGDGTGSPDSQLDICLMFLEASGNLVHINPLGTLDALYRQIMSRVPRSILPTTQMILSFYVLSPSSQSFLYDRANRRLEIVSEVAYFLGIDRDTFYSALQNLHSVIDVPPAELAREESLKFFHKSFPDFLEDPTRSGLFALDLEQARYDLAILSLRWNSYFLRSNCKIKECSCDSSAVPMVAWTRHDDTDNEDQPNTDRLKLFARTNCWKLCNEVHDSRKAGIIQELAEFNFCHLFSAFSSTDENSSFYPVVEWLWEDQKHCGKGLVRLRPSSPLDQNLASYCRKAPLPLLDLPGYSQIREDLALGFFSPHQCTTRLLLLNHAEMMFWLGTGERAVLVYGHLDESLPKSMLKESRSRFLVNRCFQSSSGLSLEYQYAIWRNMNTHLFEDNYYCLQKSHWSLTDLIAAVRDMWNLDYDDKTFSDFLLTVDDCDSSVQDLICCLQVDVCKDLPILTNSRDDNITICWKVKTPYFTYLIQRNASPGIEDVISTPHLIPGRLADLLNNRLARFVDGRPVTPISSDSEYEGGDEDNSNNGNISSTESDADETDAYFSLSERELGDDNND